MAKKQRKAKKTTHGKARKEARGAVRVLTYAITTEPMNDARYPQLPPDEVEHLHDLILSKPKAAIPELLAQIEQHPDVPMLYNYLAAAYGASGQRDKSEQVIAENFLRHPEYLFARLNHAEILLDKGEYQQVAALLDNKFDLHLFDPQRKTFHVTEFAGFMSVVGRYYLGTGDREAAERVYDTLKRVAPDDLGTQRLRARLYGRSVRRVLEALTRPRPAS